MLGWHKALPPACGAGTRRCRGTDITRAFRKRVWYLVVVPTASQEGPGKPSAPLHLPRFVSSAQKGEPEPAVAWLATASLGLRRQRQRTQKPHRSAEKDCENRGPDGSNGSRPGRFGCTPRLQAPPVPLGTTTGLDTSTRGGGHWLPRTKGIKNRTDATLSSSPGIRHRGGPCVGRSHKVYRSGGKRVTE